MACPFFKLANGSGSATNQNVNLQVVSCFFDDLSYQNAKVHFSWPKPAPQIKIERFQALLHFERFFRSFWAYQPVLLHFVLVLRM
ncbi:hypothetical protein GCM10010918_24840 [Paenibacillus radicis (ex Gao et al. 2016)]|uniref:Uncharacterized protein n=1 Tax=Paenibacillus radicis (ex Gao et al. 2016) TaxID=1737354 RepID=A0A917H688_9BACL|nr:hypothetical protein GCM10010918_24840 [Paenibacillus radicis (ex Gao et al. 2016)]